MFNKRGQGSDGGGAVVSLLIVVAIAAIIGYFVYTFFFTGVAAIDSANILTKERIALCERATQGEGEYCNIFSAVKLSDGKEGFATCRYLEEQNIVSNVSKEKGYACEKTPTEVGRAECVRQAKTTYSGAKSNWKTIINGAVCSGDKAGAGGKLTNVKYGQEDITALVTA